MPVVLLPPATAPLPIPLVVPSAPDGLALLVLVPLPLIAVAELPPELGLVLLVLMPLLTGVLDELAPELGVLLLIPLLPGVLLALLPLAPLPLPEPVMPVPVPAAALCFCSSSATRELSAESCCRIASISVAVGAAVVVVLATEESVELLVGAGTEAPGAGVVVTT